MIDVPLKDIIGSYQSRSQHWVGNGFPVRTLFSAQQLGARVSPFIMLDYGGPAEFQPSDVPRGVDEHPHKGFETVTIVYRGELEHRDSAGNSGKIGPGDVQWMTAASGIVHEEKHSGEFTKRGGVMEMVQLWVNLPAKFKSVPPAYQSLLSAQIPVVAGAGGSSARVIAGEYLGARGPARTFTPINVWDVLIAKGAKMEFVLKDGTTTLLVLLRGNVTLNGETREEGPGVVFFDRKGEKITAEASQEASVLVLNGEPIDEPVASYGPFVMNTKEEIAVAIEEYRTGLMGSLPAIR